MGEPVALFNVDGHIYALSDMCPHQGGPLSEGFIQEGTVYCPWHAWPFSLKPSKKPPNDLIRHYAVEIRDGDIYIARRESPSENG
jgi:nitrite reductase/ring-hydroxylating ferredoxin subunit